MVSESLALATEYPEVEIVILRSRRRNEPEVIQPERVHSQPFEKLCMKVASERSPTRGQRGSVKIGAENKKAVQWAAALLTVALLLGICNFWKFGSSSDSPAAFAHPISGKTPQVITLEDAALHVDDLAASQHKRYEAGGRNIFRMEEIKLPPVLPSVQKKSTVELPSTPTPLPPPINLKFYGFASKHNEPKRIFLVDEGEIFVARQGDIVERKYKVAQITNSSVVIEDALSNNRQTIPLTGR
jgi:hypothetical protein